MVAADQRRIAPFTSCTTRRARPAWRCIRRCWRSVSATSCAGTIRMPARSRSPTACASTRTAPFRRRSSLAGRSANARRCRCCVPNATPQPGWRRRPATRLQWMVHLGDTLQPAFRKRLCPQDFAPAGQGRPAHSLACASTPVRPPPCRAPTVRDGDRSGVADLYAALPIRWSRHMSGPATEWPALAALARRVMVRPSRGAPYRLEGLTEWAWRGFTPRRRNSPNTRGCVRPAWPDRAAHRRRATGRRRWTSPSTIPPRRC